MLFDLLRHAAPVLTVILHLAVAFGQESLPTPDTSQKVEMSPEVRAAVESGISDLKAKKYKDAVLALTAASRQYPTSGQLRHLLGFALAQDKQLGPAWLQLRQAVKYAPTYEPAVRDFLSMWGVFDRQGVFNAGRPSDQIAKLLGEPDGKVGESQDREVWQYGFMRVHFLKGHIFAIIDPRGLNPQTAKAKDVMKIEFDDKTRWRLGYRSINHLQSVTEYVPKSETVQAWSEMYTVQRLYDLKKKSTPSQMMSSIEETLKKTDPEIEFAALLESKSDVLFHWHNKGSKEHPAQHEIVRLVAGEQDIHRIAYARKGSQIPNDEAQVWIDVLRKAQLTKALDQKATP